MYTGTDPAGLKAAKLLKEEGPGSFLDPVAMSKNRLRHVSYITNEAKKGGAVVYERHQAVLDQIPGAAGSVEKFGGRAWGILFDPDFPTVSRVSCAGGDYWYFSYTDTGLPDRAALLSSARANAGSAVADRR